MRKGIKEAAILVAKARGLDPLKETNAGPMWKAFVPTVEDIFLVMDCYMEALADGVADNLSIRLAEVQLQERRA